jgi:hypothetical protein
MMAPSVEVSKISKYGNIWVWVNTYRYIFSGMNIHLPAILGFTRYQGFDPSPYNPSMIYEFIWKNTTTERLSGARLREQRLKINGSGYRVKVVLGQVERTGFPWNKHRKGVISPRKMMISWDW